MSVRPRPPKPAGDRRAADDHGGDARQEQAVGDGRVAAIGARHHQHPGQAGEEPAQREDENLHPRHADAREECRDLAHADGVDVAADGKPAQHRHQRDEAGHCKGEGIRHAEDAPLQPADGLVSFRHRDGGLADDQGCPRPQAKAGERHHEGRNLGPRVDEALGGADERGEREHPEEAGNARRGEPQREQDRGERGERRHRQVDAAEQDHQRLAGCEKQDGARTRRRAS